jgi:two-component system phosphate regulon response regulator OmpR
MVLKANMPHIMVVDDDDRIRRLLAQYLTKQGYIVITAEDASKARQILKRFNFDICVVDIMMPGESGLMLSRHINDAYDIPVLLLTAMSETSDRIAGLEAGADDYLPKPFDPKELLLRLQAILRRVEKSSPVINTGDEKILKFENGSLYNINKSIFKDEKGIEKSLTDGDQAILKTLSLKLNMPVKRQMLAAALDLNGNDRAVDVQITRLRKKIETDPANPTIIITLRGKGYMMKGEAHGD